MRILIYSYNYHPEPIGIAPLMTELAEGLVKKGHEVRVLTAMPWYPESKIYPEYRGKIYTEEERNGVKIYRSYVWASQKRNFINRAMFELSFAFFSFWQGLKPWKPDVILSTIPGLPVIAPAYLLSKIYGSPLVVNLQDILPDAAVHVGLLTNQKLIKIFSILENFAYKKANKISVIADGFIKNLANKNVDMDKIVKIPNWVDVDFIKPVGREDSYFIQENNLQGKFVVIYSGNIALTQPIEILIEAANKLKHLDNLMVVIVGKEEALARLEKYRQELGCENVLLKPFQPRGKLPQMLGAVEVGMVTQKSNVIDFNLPSKIPVLLASGCVIIGSVPESGTAAQAIRESGGGVVIPPEDAVALARQIEEFYHNPELVGQMGMAGRKYAETHYSFEGAIALYEQLFDEVMGR
ncbi:glycosyltransferase family 4 protein [Cyanobacterium sp. IPPAS B-1200]|uniref:glycosyltransferase family 4 protein n=1 Tax=Cyanobacterium sp. IPPAS B-1200 TaxID=1562720 RepID=UPI00085279B1|nr:glycosyltransferase family 4 protein [Cyanobacterium sp. IPPAS B-1200]OEJ77599.1 glycosyltransferase WbuB [Cyanobacterium sp. IPPAS B-1200]